MKFYIDNMEMLRYSNCSFKIETKEVIKLCDKTVFDYSKLRGRIVEKFGTQSKFADANGISDRSMSLKLNNGIGLSQNEILEWCNLLDIPTGEIPLYFFTVKVSKMKPLEVHTSE